MAFTMEPQNSPVVRRSIAPAAETIGSVPANARQLQSKSSGVVDRKKTVWTDLYVGT